VTSAVVTCTQLAVLQLSSFSKVTLLNDEIEWSPT